ncbi:zinc finger protein 354B-like isoform X2 [Ambystoma mexicanum]|uniref:zinc finger protein 354B-like isoform X2 n=1 Tax=Ambystoma mexicanum TaxID=8296 RepID=UPI0037E7DEF5
MSRQDSCAVTALDASAYFSEDEWKCLQEWQKDLCSKVMKEIQQALILLGPLIASTVSTLKTKEKHGLCSMDIQETERRHGPPFLHSKTNLKTDEDPVSIVIDDLGEEVGKSSIDSNSGCEIISFCVKEEQIDCQDDNEKKILEGNSSPAGYPIITSVFSQSMKSGEEMYLPEKRESERRNLATADPVVTSVLPRVRNTEHQRQKEVVLEGTSTGHENKKKKRKAAYYLTTTENIPACKGVHEKAKVKLHKILEKEKTSRSQLWSESNQELEGEKSLQFESTHLNAEHWKSQPQTSSIQTSYKYNDSGSNLLNANLSACQSNAQIRFIPYACPEREISYKAKSQYSRYQRPHVGERPYQCTVCGKSFSLRHHLIQHQRTHTGERPYQCNECKKRFTMKGNLNRHKLNTLCSSVKHDRAFAGRPTASL